MTKKRKGPTSTTHKPVGTAEISAGGLVKTLDVLSDPLSTLKAAYEATGLDPGAAERLVKRVQAQYQPMLQGKREYKTAELKSLLEDRLGKALEWLDDYAMSKATGVQLAVMIGILTEKRQLLAGEPTHILSIEDRMSLNKLAPALEAEFRRRGFLAEDRGDIIEVVPTVVRPGASVTRGGKKTGNVPQKLKQLELKKEIGEP